MEAAGVQESPRRPGESGICGSVCVRTDGISNNHRRRPGTEDGQSCKAAGTVVDCDSGPPPGIHYLGAVRTESEVDGGEQLPAVSGGPKGRSRRAKLVDRVAAVWPMRAAEGCRVRWEKPADRAGSLFASTTSRAHPDLPGIRWHSARRGSCQFYT